MFIKFVTQFEMNKNGKKKLEDVSIVLRLKGCLYGKKIINKEKCLKYFAYCLTGYFTFFPVVKYVYKLLKS